MHGIREDWMTASAGDTKTLLTLRHAKANTEFDESHQ
jgi:hypothetical protein